MQIIDAGNHEPTAVSCPPCLARRRRGGRVIFGSTSTADLHDWVARHRKHAPETKA